MFLSVSGVLLLFGFEIAHGQVTCDMVYPPDCDTADEPCENLMNEGCISIDEEWDSFPSTTDVINTDDCDDDDLDAHNWSIDYIGQSTQFRLYDPCDGDWIKFKMEDLTEYDSNGKKTGNKEVAFASADWKWGDNGALYSSYSGYNAIVNSYNATSLTKMDASLLFTTIFFRENTSIGGTIYQRNALKFSVSIRGWDYANDGDYIEMCIDILTKNANGPVVDNLDGTIEMNGFVITNEEYAECEGSATDMDVSAHLNGNMRNHLGICYVFHGRCDSGNIYYDPILTPIIHDGSDDDSDSDVYDQLGEDDDDNDVKKSKKKSKSNDLEDEDISSGNLQSFSVALLFISFSLCFCFLGFD